MTDKRAQVPQPYSRQFKQNWDAFRTRMAAWWHDELPTPIVRIPTPKWQWRPEVLPDDTDWEAHAGDVAAILRSREGSFADNTYLSDHAPCYDIGAGHGIGTFLGCPMEYRRETVWMHPCLASLDDELDVTRWRTDERWLAYKERVRVLAARAAGRYGFGYYLGGVAQALALMRGDQPLLIEMIERPEAIDEWLARLLPEWFAMAEELEAVMPPRTDGWTLFWLWAPGRAIFAECDVSCNFSPALFRRFVVPEVQAMARWAPYSMYHLDGPGALQHVDALLEIPELGVIQWIRGEGSGGALDYLPVMRRILDGGKKLYTECSCDELEPLLAQLPHKGLLVHVDPCPDPAKVDHALRVAAKHGADQSY